uniref:Amino acid transporter transmembrane domain-containing protein n=1 Tax=Arundo donax TaxID=35708 RepID=A0A0A9EWB6_ARUDO
MAERGMLPDFFAKRSRYETPLIDILFSAFGVVLLSWMSFQEIIAVENYLYCFGMILEFTAFITLRVTHPTASRPYKIPLGTIGAVLMIIPPALLIVVVMTLASYKVMAVSIMAMVVGFVLQPCLVYVKKKR